MGFKRLEKLEDINSGALEEIFHDMFRPVFFLHQGKFLSKRVDGGADGVVQRRAAGASVFRHQVVIECGQINVFNDPFGLVGELIEVEDGLAFRLFLFLDKRIETPLGVAFDGSH